MFIACAAVFLVAAVLLAVGLWGRRIDNHPVCRRCKFDLIGLYPGAGVCPECGAALDGRNAVRLGQRRRRLGALVIGLVLLPLAGGGAGVSLWAASRGIDWNQYKPVWWLRADVRFGSFDTVGAAGMELSSRAGAGTLGPAALDSVLTTLTSAMERGRLPPSCYGAPLAGILTGRGISDAARDRLVAWILEVQTDRAKPWSSELGSAVLAECLAHHISDETMEQFLRQSCTPRLQTMVHRPLRPGETVPVIVTLDERGGDANAEVESSVPGLSPIFDPYLFSGFTRFPGADSQVLGAVTAPREPGTYVLEGTVYLGLSASNSILRGFTGSSGPRAAPAVRQSWPVRLRYEVADSPPDSPAQAAAERMFWADCAAQILWGGGNHQCTLDVLMPGPGRIAFDVSWRYGGREVNVASGTLEYSEHAASSSLKFTDGSGSSSSSSSGDFAYSGPRRERFDVQVPVGHGRATTGTLVLHITRFALDGAAPVMFEPFDYEIPGVRVRW